MFREDVPEMPLVVLNRKMWNQFVWKWKFVNVGRLAFPCKKGIGSPVVGIFYSNGYMKLIELLQGNQLDELRYIQ